MNYRCKPVMTIAKFAWLGIFLAISATACTAGKNAPPSPPLAPVSTAPAPQPTPAPQTAPAPQPNQSELYQQALSKADAANAIGQSAISKDDWFLVAQSLQESVQMLKSIDPNSTQYRLAAQVLPKYEQQLTSATRKAANFSRKVTTTTQSQPQSIATTTTSAPPQTAATFSIPIQEKLGGVPVIEVTMNGTKVSMLMDTGASHTLITSSVARRLKLQIDGSSQASTANGNATFDSSTIDRVKFGAGEVTQLRVAIGQDNLPYGLLGHDVYDGYDITIKESSIEFRKR